MKTLNGFYNILHYCFRKYTIYSTILFLIMGNVQFLNAATSEIQTFLDKNKQGVYDLVYSDTGRVNKITFINEKNNEIILKVEYTGVINRGSSILAIKYDKMKDKWIGREISIEQKANMDTAEKAAIGTAIVVFLGGLFSLLEGLGGSE